MAFLSNVAALEVFVGGIGELVPVKMRRGGLILIVLAIEAALMLPSALVPGTIGALDLIFGSGMQVLGSGLAIVALVWGMGRVPALRQMFGTATASWHPVLLLWLRWVVPGALILILIGYIRSKMG